MQENNMSFPDLFAFVNVDGVLTSARTYWQRDLEPEDRLDPTVLAILSKFCKELRIKVVMATAWDAMYPTAEAWRNLFASKGFDIPVIDVLPCKDFDWFSDAKDYMSSRDNSRFVLFQDDPVTKSPDEKRVIQVDSLVGLTTLNLLQAAQVLAPYSAVASELAALNKSFSPNATITIRIGNGPLQEVPVHGIADVVSEHIQGNSQ